MQNAQPAAEAAPQTLLLNPTVAELMDAYLADRRNPHAERPCKHPESLASVLKPMRALWGGEPIETFRATSKARVKVQCAGWREAGLTAHTVRKRVSVLKTVFRFAVEEELIERGQEPVIKLPPNGPPRERFLDDQTELPALLKAADEIDTPDHIRLLLELALRTGQRRGAILALRWSHVDFEKREIRFRDTEAPADRSKKRRGNKAMDDDLFALMQWAYERRSEHTDAVIHWRDKAVRNPYTGLRALYRRAGITNLRTHDMRKASATYVDMAFGGDLAKSAKHIDDTEATARKHYVMPNTRATLPAIEAVSGFLAKARA